MMHSSVGVRDSRKDETWVKKYLVVPGLVLVTCLSVSLLVMNQNHWARPMSYVADNRSVVAILVQVISQLLGVIYSYALCKAPNGLDSA